jgi:DNA-binding transcriptional ArsR family regulator
MVHMNVFQILAEPARKQIVETLKQGERQVNDLVQALNIHQSGVSRHLRILLEAGFVQVRPHGQLRLYSLRPEPFQELDGWVGGYRQLWEARVDRFGEALKKKQRGELAAAPVISHPEPEQANTGRPAIPTQVQPKE